MLHIVACDDEKDFLDLLDKELEKRLLIPYSLTKISSSMKLEELMTGNPEYTDVLLMDIRMYKDNGIELAANLLRVCSQLKVIFITGFIGEYYEAVFMNLRPYGVLSKPVDWDRLILLLGQISKEDETRRHVLVRVRSGAVNADLDKIYYIESIKRTMVVHGLEETLTSYGSLTKYKELLPSNFLHCHKSFLVNMDYIKSFINRTIVMVDGTVINVSKARAGESKKNYFIYMGMGI